MEGGEHVLSSSQKYTPDCLINLMKITCGGVGRKYND